MIRNTSDIFQLMENWAPKHLAYDWDNVGLQIGSYQKNVKKIMITLDVLESVVDEAIDKKADLIIAHHPLLFKPMNQLNTGTPQGRVIQKLIQHNISVYAAHTNLDIASGGVNDIMSDLLNIKSKDVLIETDAENLFKIAVYVPKSHIENVRNAFNEAGAGYIGNYSHCTFQSAGQGTFKPLEGTNPYIGTTNEIEFVPEVKIETIVQEEQMDRVIRAVIDAHPYEEVAYDIYPLENKGESYGLGRIGTINEKLTLQEFCDKVKEAFDISHLRVTGDLTKEVKKVAVLGGSGEKYHDIARKKDADVYITGDMTFHAAQDAWVNGLAVIDPGHHVEKVMKKATKKYLDEKLQDENVEILLSESNTDPFQFL
ncbi:Nif3-like dinuclear metal center hexameric protein [Virgibacillus ainsalahensis]